MASSSKLHKVKSVTDQLYPHLDRRLVRVENECRFPRDERAHASEAHLSIPLVWKKGKRRHQSISGGVGKNNMIKITTRFRAVRSSPKDPTTHDDLRPPREYEPRVHDVIDGIVIRPHRPALAARVPEAR